MIISADDNPRSASNDAGARRTSLPHRVWYWCKDFLRTPGRPAEFLRYTFVSGSSLALDLVVFALILWVAAMTPALAGAFSCMVGLVLHYILSVTFVFDAKATGKSDYRLLGEYALTGVMGFAITAGAILLFVDAAGMPAWFGKGVGIGSTFVSVYLVRARFVFAPRSGNGTANSSRLTTIS